MQGKQEIKFIKSNGKPCWSLLSGTPIIDHTFKGGFCMFTDNRTENTRRKPYKD